MTELSRFVLILTALFICLHGIFLKDIPSSFSKGNIPTGNPQRNLEANNYIILSFNQNCEYPNGFKNNYRNGISHIKLTHNNLILNPTDKMTINEGSEIEIHFSESLKTLEYFFDVGQDKNVEFIEMIDFNYFDSSKVQNMNYMLGGCKSLKSIKFGDFSTNEVTTMRAVFINCHSLKYLDLSSFNTEKVRDTSFMFNNCYLLIYLDISNFNLLNVQNDDSMLSFLNNLNYINLRNVKDKTVGIRIENNKKRFVKEILKIEQKLLHKHGLSICRNSYTDTIDNFIYCCDYSFEGNFCLEKKNYITISYDRLVEYHQYTKPFANKNREKINFIYSEYYNNTIKDIDLKYVHEYSKIEIHFLFPLNSLNNFFCPEQRTLRKTIRYQNSVYTYTRNIPKNRQVFDLNMQYLYSVDFSHFDSSKVTSMESLFEGCYSLRSVNFGNIDSSKVISMGLMFYNCNNLISVDMSMFDTSKVTTFFWMFEYCYSLISVDISNFDTLQVKYYTYYTLFEYPRNFKYLNIKNIKHSSQDFYDYLMGGLRGRDLTVCQTENIVTGNKIRDICCDFNILKERCISSNYISLYYNKSVKYKSFINKYRKEIGFIIYNDKEYLPNEINISPGVKLEIHFLKVINTLESFFDSNYDNNVKYLASIDFSNFEATSVTSFKKMFYGCSSLISINFTGIHSNSLCDMESMFQNCLSLTSINLSNFYLDNIKTVKSMFEGCKNLLSVNLSNFRTENLHTFEKLFKNCYSLKILDISNFNLSIINHNYLNMFFGVEHLRYLRIYNISDKNNILRRSPLNKIDELFVCQNDNIINNLNIYNICCTFNVETEVCESDNYILLYFNKDSYYGNGFKNDFREKIDYLIYNTKIITEEKKINIFAGRILAIYFFEKVTTMESFFDADYDENMKNVISIDLSHFDLSLVSHFEKMFYGCSSLLSINLSDFKVSSFVNMRSMFEGCVSLLSINLTSNKKITLLNGANMFKNCLSLRLIDISNFILTIISNSTDMFDNVNNLKYIKLIDVEDRMSIIKKSPLNEIKNLIVCQKKEFITNINTRKICCDFNIETNKCENDYYITFYFNQDSFYRNGFKNYYRENINYIIYNDEVFSEKKEIYIKAGSKIEVHYNYPIYNSENLFRCEDDKNMDNVISVDLTHFNFSFITNLNYLFYKCYSIKSINFPNSSEINQIINMSKLFSGCNSLISLNLSNIINSKIGDLSYMFENCTSLKFLDISKFSFTKDNNITNIFRNMNNLKYINLYNSIDINKYISQTNLNNKNELLVCQKNKIITNTNAQNICCNYSIETDMCVNDNFIIIYFNSGIYYQEGFKNNMRNNISFIIHENLIYSGTKRININANSKMEIHFNNPINNLESFFDSFYDNNMNSIISIDFSHFDASLVTSFKKTFNGCSKLQFIDFSNINTSNANDMSMMFESCTSLLSLNLSSFNTRKVKYINRMFNNCISLLSLDLCNFNLENIINSTDIFNNIKNIKYINIFNFKDKNKIISGGILNETDNLTVCQKNKEIITNKNIINDCCFYDVISKSCKSNYIIFNFFSEKNVNIYSNEFIKKISYIKYSGKMIINESFTVNSSNEAELHFIYPISDLSEFFLLNDNKIMENVKSVDFSHFNSNLVTNISKMFYECYATESIDFYNFNTSNVVDMSYMFHHCNSLKSLDLSSFDTSKVSSVDNMFFFCYNLKSLDLSHFNSQNIISSIDMFEKIEILKYINLYYAKDYNNILSGSYVNEIDNLTVCQREKIITNKKIDTSCCDYNIETDICELTNYIIVYYGKNDTEYNSGFINDYRNSIGYIIHENSKFLKSEGFTVKSGSKIKIYFINPSTTLESFFDQRYDERVINIISIDFSYFDSSMLTSIDYIFYGCTSLLSIDLTNFIFSSITRMNYMFSGCSSLKSLNLSNINTSSLMSANSLFKNCNSLNSLDISNLNLTNLIEVNEMFYNLTNLKYINLYDIETSEFFLNETDTEFNNTDNLIVCQNSDIITNPNITKICCNYNIKTDLCESSNYLTVYYGKTDTEYNSNFLHRFRNNIGFLIYENSSLSVNDKFTIKADSKIEIHFSTPLLTLESFFNKDYDIRVVNIISIDFSHFDSSKLNTLYMIFYGCSSLISFNFTNFDTYLVDNTAYMFYGCTSLSFIDLTYLNTSSVVTMNHMFYDCKSLIAIDLSNLDTSKVYTVANMFYGCSSLTFIDLSNLNTSLIRKMNDMFHGCSSLKSIDLSNFKTTILEDIYNMFLGCSSLKCIDISGFEMKNIKDARKVFTGLSSLEYINLYNVTTDQFSIVKMRNELIITDNLIVCQNSDIIINPNITQICCSFNIETDLCESSNYLIIYYGQNETQYDFDFINKYRNNISFIINENSTLEINNNFTIKTYSKIEIHFSTPLTTLESFFDQRYDERVVNIISIDFSHFDSSLLTSLYNLFYGCSSLISLNFANFDTSFVNNMANMFYKCTSLQSIDLSYFDFSSVLYLNNIFDGCSSLKILDISGINFRNISYLEGMFYNLTNLKYINLYDIETSEFFLNEANKELNNRDNLIVCQNSDIITNPNIKKICCDYNIKTDLCESSNYITVYYGINDIEYNSDFINKYRKNISFIIYENSYLGINEQFTIKADSKLEIHFSSPLTTLESFFNNNFDEKVVNIISIDFSHFDSSLLTSFYNTFFGCNSLISINFINFNTPLLNIIQYMFYNCTSLSYINLSNFDTSSVTSMRYMFYNCVSLLSIDLSKFNTLSTINMDYMFYNCISLQSLNLSNFNTSSLVNIGYMFCGCSSLEFLDISGFNMINIEEASNLFDNLTSLKYISLYGIQVSELFLNETNKELNNRDNLIVCQNSDIITNPNIKQHCCDIKIESCEFTNYIIVYYGNNDTEYNSGFINDYRNNISFIINENSRILENDSFIVKSGSKIEIYFSTTLTTLESFFDQRYDKRVVNIISIDFSYFDSSLLTSIDYISYKCNSLKSINMNNFNTSLLTSMNSSFYDCNSLEYLDLSNFDTSLLKNIEYLFYGCTSLKFIDLSNWNFNKVENMSYIFYNLKSLEYFSFNNIQISSNLMEKINEFNFTNNLIICQNSNIITDLKIRNICCDYNFETHQCQSSNYITIYYNNNCNYINGFKNQYRNNISFINYLNRTNTDTNELNIISGSKLEIHFNTPISNIEKFFSRDSDSNNVNIESIDFSQFDSSLVTNMNSLFSGCTSLKSINFSNVDTSLVIDMSNTFYNCRLLELNDLNYFNTSKVINMTNMFYNCRSLTNLNLSNFDTSSLLNMNSMFRNVNKLITLDISNFDTSKVTNMGNLFSGCSSLKNLYYLSKLDSPSVINRIGMFDGCVQLFGPDNQDYQSGYNNSNDSTDIIIFSSTIINNYNEDIEIILLGFDNYSLIDSKVNFNIYFLPLEYFEFPQLFNFTAIIVYNSILRILDIENNVNCQKQEIGKENQFKYKCIIDTKNSDIKNIVLNNDINFESKKLNLIISPLASEYMNNLQNLPNKYNNLFNEANMFLLQKSMINQDGRLFNISGIMENDPHFEINKNITLIAKPESEQEKKEINCNIIDNTLERYTINCKLDNNMKYDLNYSLSINDNNIILVIFDDKSSIINNTNTSQYSYRVYSKKSSGLSTGAIIAIILVPIIALAFIISIIIFFKRKNSNKIISNNFSSNVNINMKN